MSRSDEHWERIMRVARGQSVIVTEPCEVVIIRHHERLVLPVGAKIEVLSVSRLALLGIYSFAGRQLTVCVRCPDWGSLEARWLPSEWRARTFK